MSEKAGVSAKEGENLRILDQLGIDTSGAGNHSVVPAGKVARMTTPTVERTDVATVGRISTSTESRPSGICNGIGAAMDGGLVA